MACHRIMIETESSLATQNYTDPHLRKGHQQSLFWDAHNLIHSPLLIQLCHIFREQNTYVDWLAKIGLSKLVDSCNSFCIPIELSHLLYLDDLDISKWYINKNFSHYSDARSS